MLTNSRFYEMDLVNDEMDAAFFEMDAAICLWMLFFLKSTLTMTKRTVLKTIPSLCV